jgi:hypothetical protein
MNTKSILVGAAAGSALTFLLDPNGGGRRRALVRDQMVRATRKTREGLDATARDLANRAAGINAATRARWSNERVDDRTLVDRVRAKLGRGCSHPRAIDVEARSGELTLRGPVLSSEMADILAMARSMRGVMAVHNALEPHQTAEGIPALQGTGRLAEPSLDVLQHHWAPATRALVAAGVVATGVWMAVSATRASHESTASAAM